MSSPETRLTLSPEAQKDLIGILRYTGERWGRKQLFAYRDKLKNALLLLAQNPQLGYESGELPDTYRLYFVGSHVVVYRIRENAVEVARILHQRMSAIQHI